MRISDWSSDVCSSDLGDIKARGGVELYRAVVEDRGGGQPALFDDLGIEVRLERRAGLARGIGAVDRGGGGIEAAAADLGEQLAGSIVGDDSCAVDHPLAAAARTLADTTRHPDPLGAPDVPPGAALARTRGVVV